MKLSLPAHSAKVSVVMLFLAALYLRFFTEFIDRKLGFGVSNVVSAAFLVFSLLCIIRLRRFPLIILILSLILLAIFCSSIFSALFVGLVEPTAAMVQSFKYLIYTFLPLVGYAIGASDVGGKLLYRCVYYALVPSVLYAIIDGATGGASASLGVGAEGRAFGFGSHPVLFGVQLVLMLSILLVADSSGVAKGERRVSVLFYVLISLALLFTYAKTAWLFYSVLILLYHFKLTKSGAFVGAIVAGVIAMAFFVLRNSFSGFLTIYDFVSSGAYLVGNNYEYVDSSMHWRVIQWVNLFEVGTKHFWMGVGPAQVVHYNTYNLSAHSSTLEIFVEQGIFGFVSYLSLLTYLIFISLFKFKENIVLKVNVFFFVLMSTFSISLFNQTLNMTLMLLFVGFCVSPAIRGGERRTYEK